MKKEMLKVIRLNLTFCMCCLKKLAWHKRCWHTQSPGEVPAGCADNTNFHISNEIPKADLDVDEHIELLCAGLERSRWEGCVCSVWGGSLLCVLKFYSLPSCRAGSPGPPNHEESTGWP